jgi:hypothetical protein
MTSQRLPLIGQTQELFLLDALSLFGMETHFAGRRKIFKVFLHGALPLPAMITQTLCSAFRMGKTDSEENQIPPKENDQR